MNGEKLYFASGPVLFLTIVLTIFGGCNPNLNVGNKDTSSSATNTNTDTTLNTGFTGTIVAGGLAMNYTDGDGIPNIKATPTLTPDTLTSTGTIGISVPVDTDVTEILFRPKSLEPDVTDEEQKTATSCFAWGTISNGIATAALELFPTTAMGFYGVEMMLQYRPNYGNNAGLDYSVGGLKTYQTFSNASVMVDTQVAYPTYQVTATSTMGTTSSEPIPVSVNTQKKALVKPNGVTYLNMAGSTPGKLYAIHLSTTSQQITLSTSNTSTAGSGMPNTTVVEEDSGAGVPLQFSNSSTTNYTVVSFLVREAAEGVSTAPVVLATKTPVASAAKGIIPNFYSVPVTSGSVYNVSLWALPPNAGLGTKLSCYNGDALYSSATLTPTVASAFTQGLSCLLTANTDTAYFTIVGVNGFGAAYNMVVQPPAVSFGSLMAPVALTSGPTATSSSSAYQTQSYYAFTGAPASGKATFSNLSAPVFVYFSSGTNNGFNCNLDPIESASLVCPYTYSAAGTVTVVVTGATTAGAYFDLKLE